MLVDVGNLTLDAFDGQIALGTAVAAVPVSKSDVAEPDGDAFQSLEPDAATDGEISHFKGGG